MTIKVGNNKERLENALQSIRFTRLILSPAWRDSLIAFLTGRVFYTLIGIIAWSTKFRPDYADRYYYNLAPVNDGLAGAFLGVWQRWDSIHYLRIATYGYIDDHISLFYPLYPLTGRWLSQLTHLDPLITLILVSNLTFLLSMVLLHKFTSQHFSEQTARMTLMAMVLFPSSFYFYAIFPQSLLLFLFLLTYYLVRRGWWACAVVPAFLAGLTHSTAVALSILVGIEAIQFLWPKIIAIRQKRFVFEWNILFALITPLASLLGIISFLAWREMSGFSPYIELQSAEYARAITMPWDGMAAIIRFMIAPSIPVNIFVAWANNVCFVLMIFFTILGFRRIPWSWWFMQIGFLVFITTNLTSGYPLIGFFRYTIAIFPLFTEIAILGQQPRWRLVKFGLGLILSIFFSAMFFLWQYDM